MAARLSDAERTLLEALHADAADHAARLALADALEDTGRVREAEVARLHARQLMKVGTREELDRLCALLEGGARPVVPEVVNSVGMRFALIPPGEFQMGSPEWGANDDDEPQHEVKLTRPFYQGVYAVTQAEYREVLGESPSWHSASGEGKGAVEGLDTSRFPVEHVSHADAVRFCERLSARAEEARAGRLYRLPSEAEWEYSCRGGAASFQVFHFGDSLSSRQANFCGDAPHGGAEKGEDLGRPCAVGSYAPNAFGLYDMHGNVWEWCSDWYWENTYKAGPFPRVDPHGPTPDLLRVGQRVSRGGSWGTSGVACQSAWRGSDSPGLLNYNLGFRVCLVSSGGNK